MKNYDHKKIEKKWQGEWAKKKIYQAKDFKGDKFYSLVEFPYPSGDGLHVGHPRPYIGMDIISRKKRMEGKNVLFPMGWDAFGLPAENYAIKTGKQPSVITKKNSDNFRRQIQSLGISFDWSREINTTDPNYYKWTQWLFLQFLKKGLAYKAKSEINWCPKDKCGLANEEVIDGKCERCGTVTVKKEKEQWMLGITKYAERLDRDLDLVDYPERVKSSQRNWIGKSEGSEIEFKIKKDGEKKINRKVLIGTRNPAKVAMIKACFSGVEGLELVSLDDISFVDDSSLKEGNDFLKNAKMKSEFYFKKTGLPTISTDNILWIEKWPKDNGVITHIREIANPKTKKATDQETLIFLQNFLKKVGGESKAHFIYAIAFTDELGTHVAEEIPGEYILQTEQAKSFWSGYPAEALLKDLETGAFKSEQKNDVRYKKVVELLRKDFLPKILPTESIKVFTTRADTLFGATYVVLAPEHRLVNKFLRKEKIFFIIHGTEQNSKKNWYPWLKYELEKEGHKVIVPDLPNSQFPVLKDWIDTLSKYQEDINENTIIIGHSLGCPTAIQFIQKLNKKIDKLILIAPTHKDMDWNAYGKIHPSKNNINIRKVSEANTDWEKVKGLVNKTFAFFSKDDPHIPISVKDYYERDMAAKNVIFNDKGHFNHKNMKDNQFPELLSFVKNFDDSILENKDEIEKYISDVNKKSDLERTENKEKTGVELKGIKAINPANNEEIPIYIADYVLAGYGTGAVMAVPAHDERDFEFAKKYELPIRQVIAPHFLEPKNPPQKDKPTKRRKTIHIILERKSDSKVLMLDWIGKEWGSRRPHTFIMGGVEEGEDVFEAAKREVEEETGYFNLKSTGEINLVLHTEYYAAHKLENRYADISLLHFILENEEQRDIDPEELKKHIPTWIEKNKIIEFTNVTDGPFEINWFNDGPSAIVDDGIVINSRMFSNLNSEEARTKITEFVGGKMVTKFKLRDWVFSRQRYWGEPIPVVNCENCGLVPVKEKDLPVKLPPVKSYKPTDSGESPLAGILKWVNTKCPKCGGKAKRETDTMPNWAGSSWYYLRYTDSKNKKEFASKKNLKYWTPVDWYNGGMEHTTLHLLYSRFWHKFLFDLKLVPTVEPYKKRTSHGMILGEGGVKMSKSLGNVVNPDEIVKTYGADTLRVYEMFIGPFEDTAVWNTESIIGSRRFIEKVWRIGEKVLKQKNSSGLTLLRVPGGTHTVSNSSVVKILNKTIKKVGEDIEAMRFNTAISAMMILATEMEKTEFVDKDDFKKFLKILAPFAPHIAEDIWHSLGEKKSINISIWPKYDEMQIIDDEVKIAVQVNGKTRAEIIITASMKEDEIKEFALKEKNVISWIENKEIKRVIYVPGRIINIVV